MADFRSEAEAQFPYLIGADGARDHLAWAKRIMYREKKGDTLLTHYYVKEARMALGLTQNNQEKK